MAHRAEKTKELDYKEYNIRNSYDLNIDKLSEIDILFVSFPKAKHPYREFKKYLTFIDLIYPRINDKCNVIIFADNEILALLTFGIRNEKNLNYKRWISIRQEINNNNGSLLNETKGAVIFSKDASALKICKVRLPYTYCPSCNKTTKDYGGKKHLYHEYGTLISDVWKDITINSNDPLPQSMIKRLRDMFSIEPYSNMVSLTLWDFDWDCCLEKSIELPTLNPSKASNRKRTKINESCLILGDALKELRKIDTASVDYVFVDPPYNLKKQYTGYHDNLELEEYLLWCDQWLDECVRILKPGKYLSILNLSLWCCRHFAFLASKMDFSNWITWEGLSRPAQNIMPANYTILTMKKPHDEVIQKNVNINLPKELMPRADHYCLRESCIKKREEKFKPLTDLWTDIHRLVHNSKRYNHPCQLPPKLIGRLIAIHTKPDDIVLDCFNGVGTTTLCAQWLKRRYIGIEINKTYYNVAQDRHCNFISGLDSLPPNYSPSSLKVKNNNEERRKSPNPRITGFTKKAVQLMIRDLSKQLNKVPVLSEALEYLPVPEEFYRLYFKSWTEAVAAAKTTGMTEYKIID
ncbi:MULTISPECIES: DNA-methyltransferase [Pelosinus]|uniref:DNA methylase N-4/N-6 domain protein n=1 Tax=Pelosinus fermentans B4 TaxID=1149862 RepID=I9LGU2_9FIRM|nr:MULTISPECIES: site-specific DNA-methyltransferase [Pelosinus]EIW19591.1 DNA methylase N-4/N-6 domain protein [Pelosinus fermentans B4]EIW24675.1 DNA methylase N-4/N-6 domain protein [Pelosinus fermentans A11]OAM96044.1 DNA methylase N-4/N-6 domain protein [Pelosinus fermentans DSM 17108]SDR35716.1 site-specific DNA-methyltransferase (adenine-specific) [Pelosinus fermentans]